jgi:type I restriction enzyme, S subunit
MIGDLKPYSDYKDSGLPWLGQIPRCWEVKRAKSIFQRIDQRSRTGKEELLTVSSARGIVPRKTANVTMFKAESYLGYKLCWPGDLVINSLWAWAGGLGVSRHHGIISSAYGVYRVRQDAPMTPAFVHEVVRSSPFSWELRVRSKGVWISRLQLTDISFLDAPMHLPTPDEQAAIVRFLEWANGRLERAIRAKRKVIALLNEQKQAFIHRAVTRGLDLSVLLKPSGVPWLGNIPRHWQVVALGRLASARCDGPFGSGLKSMHYTDSGVRVIRLQNIGDGEFRDRSATFISERHYATLGDHSVVEGDLLVAGLGDEKIPAGRACVAPPLLGPAMVKADCFRFRPNTGRAVPSFLARHLSATAAGATACLSTGATRLRINLSTTAARSVALPPVEEQKNIVDFIGKAISPSNTAISRLEREIELLREYRTRLVADVVTGKLDVREAAQRLPDETPKDTTEGIDDLGDETEPTEEVAV